MTGDVEDLALHVDESADGKPSVVKEGAIVEKQAEVAVVQEVVAEHQETEKNTSLTSPTVRNGGNEELALENGGSAEVVNGEDAQQGGKEANEGEKKEDVVDQEAKKDVSKHGKEKKDREKDKHREKDRHRDRDRERKDRHRDSDKKDSRREKDDGKDRKRSDDRDRDSSRKRRERSPAREKDKDKDREKSKRRHSDRKSSQHRSKSRDRRRSRSRCASTLQLRGLKYFVECCTGFSELPFHLEQTRLKPVMWIKLCVMVVRDKRSRRDSKSRDRRSRRSKYSDSSSDDDLYGYVPRKRQEAPQQGAGSLSACRIRCMP